MTTALVTAPTAQPILLEEVREHLRIDGSDNDAYVSGLIAGATAYAEEYTGRKFITQTWKMYLDRFPTEDYIEIPFGQLQSVTSVVYTDSNDSDTTFSTDYYSVDTDSTKGRVVLDYGETWPSTTLATNNPICITFVCGYGSHTLKTITGASSASPIVLTSAAHGYTTGDMVAAVNVGGNTAANGTWMITKATDDTFSLNGSAYNAAYTSGGQCYEVSVPIKIRQAILILASHWFENREGAEIPPAVHALLREYRLPSY